MCSQLYCNGIKVDKKFCSHSPAALPLLSAFSTRSCQRSVDISFLPWYNSPFHSVRLSLSQLLFWLKFCNIKHIVWYQSLIVHRLIQENLHLDFPQTYFNPNALTLIRSLITGGATQELEQVDWTPRIWSKSISAWHPNLTWFPPSRS